MLGLELTAPALVTAGCERSSRRAVARHASGGHDGGKGFELADVHLSLLFGMWMMAQSSSILQIIKIHMLMRGAALQWRAR
ncbi:MAG: hypothetical protein QM777_03040 [Pseudorhodoferax sp.]